jgi:hypothetical protein
VFEVKDVGADVVDDARDLEADDAWRTRRVRVEAHAREQVGEVDAGGEDANAHLSRTDAWILHLAHAQDARRAMARDDDLFHASSISRTGEKTLGIESTLKLRTA